MIVRGELVSAAATIYNFGTGPANELVVTVFPYRGIVVIGQCRKLRFRYFFNVYLCI